METVVEVDPKKSTDFQIEKPKVPVTELKVLQPRQTSSLERRLNKKRQNSLENGHSERPVPCEFVTWAPTGDGADLLRVIEVSKSPRGSLKRNQEPPKSGRVDEGFLKSPRLLEKLSVEEISQCLVEIGFESLVQRFFDEKIDGKQFVDLDEDILIELDVDKKEDRQKIMQLVKEGVFRPRGCPEKDTQL